MQNNKNFFWLIIILIAISYFVTSKTELKNKDSNTKQLENKQIISYDKFLSFIDKIDASYNKEEVKKLLGNPTSISDSTWVYNLQESKGFPGIPPPVGVTVFPSVSIDFEHNKVKEVSKSWFDTTGPIPNVNIN